MINQIELDELLEKTFDVERYTNSAEKFYKDLDEFFMEKELGKENEEKERTDI